MNVNRLGSVECPFELCTARIEVVHEPRGAGPVAGPHVNRVPQHRFESDMAWGEGENCPASLMVLPLGAAAQAALDDFAIMIRRADKRRRDDDAAAAKRQGDAPMQQPQHSKAPRPDGRARWFRWNGPGPTDRRRS